MVIQKLSANQYNFRKIMDYCDCPMTQTDKSTVLKTLPHVYYRQEMPLPHRAFPRHFPYSHWHSLHSVSKLLFLMLCHKEPMGERKEMAFEQAETAEVRREHTFHRTLLLCLKFFQYPLHLLTRQDVLAWGKMQSNRIITYIWSGNKVYFQ